MSFALFSPPTARRARTPDAVRDRGRITTRCLLAAGLIGIAGLTGCDNSSKSPRASTASPEQHPAAAATPAPGPSESATSSLPEASATPLPPSAETTAIEASQETAADDRVPTDILPPAGDAAPATGQVALQKPAASAAAASAFPSATTYSADKKKKFDPVAVNGPLFVDWSAPKFALLITGLQQGYLEPCGCAGLENQKGGLARRHALMRELEARSWPLVAIDAGGLIRRFGRQEEIKYQTTLDALRTLNYEAVGFGAADLALPAENLLAATGDLTDDEAQTRFVSANVGLFGIDTNAVGKFRVTTIDGVRIGITSVLGPSAAKQVANKDVEVIPADKALAGIQRQLLADADVRVLLIHSTIEEATAIAKQFPIFDVIAVADNGDEPNRETIAVPGTKSQIVTLGHKGMYAAVLGYYGDAKPQWRYQRVPLDSRFEDSSEMRQLMVAYQEQLQALGLEGLGLRAVVHPRGSQQGADRGAFAGAGSCAECHPTAHGIWSKSAHAHATESLIKKSVPPRQFDPECLSCHVTGWHPQEYIPYETGFASMPATPELAGNGCENCHGPSAAHVAAERARGKALNLSLRNQLRAELQLTRATVKQTCEQCHDEDNSPEFDFDRYWPKVEHRGKK